MRSPSQSALVVSGLGITSAIGQGQASFTEALLAGRHRFGHMQRPGRQLPVGATGATGASGASGAEADAPAPYIGAEIAALAMPSGVERSLLRTASFSAQAALATLHEAWHDAALDQVAPARIGLVVGGSNVQQREQVLAHDSYAGRTQFLRPSYGMSFLDTDVCGLCTEAFGIRGFAHTVGGASASGQLAVIEAIHAVQSGRVEVCIAIGALMDLSYWECQGLRSLGAMGSDRYCAQPAQACRPFDQQRDGFIFGEACAVLVIEKLNTAERRARAPYARLTGWAVVMDAHRNPNPSVEGEVGAIKAAMARAGLIAPDIDYINPHGTASAIGDSTELESLRRCELGHARINATKSVTGHGLSAAGAVELVATLVQMKAERLHPTNNLEQPIDAGFQWVRQQSVAHRIDNALNLSMGFGGINTAVCLQRFA